MAKQEHTDYLLRNVEDSLWRQVKARAALEGKDVREVIIEALKGYVTAGMEKPKKKK
jgi:plasmid stability protein